VARGKRRVDAILAAAVERLEVLGYAALTIDAVAEAARASKATIYRRFRNKAELVKAALDAYEREHQEAVPNTGALRSDLIGVMQNVRRRSTPAYVAMLHGISVAARYDAELAGLLQAHVETAELSPFHAVLRRAVDRGQLPANAPSELVHEVAEAMVMRQLQAGFPFDDDFITRVVDQVLLPLLRPRISSR